MISTDSTNQTSTQTSTNWAAVIEGCLLVGIGAMLLRKTVDGQLPLYIHPRYQPLVLATALVVLLIGGFRLWQIGEAAERMRGRLGMYGLLLAPLLLGVLIPARPAGSALIDPEQLGAARGEYRSDSALATSDSRKWDLFDWTVARATLPAEEIRGRPVDVVGFVYRDERTTAGEFYVVRYTLACCVADRSGMWLAVAAGDTALPNDQWVRVVGTVDTRLVGDRLDLVVVDAQIEPVEQPSEPYLYQ